MALQVHEVKLQKDMQSSTKTEHDTFIEGNGCPSLKETGRKFGGFPLIAMDPWYALTCSLLGGIGDGGREGVVLDFGGGGEMISSVSSALPKEPSSMLAFEETE